MAQAEDVGPGDRDLHSLEEVNLIRTTSKGVWCMHRVARAFGQRAGTHYAFMEARKAFVRGCSARAVAIRNAGMAVYLADRPHFDAALFMAREVLTPAEELKLLLLVGPAMLAQRGYASDEVGSIYARAVRVAEQMGGDEQLFTEIGRASW